MAVKFWEKEWGKQRLTVTNGDKEATVYLEGLGKRGRAEVRQVAIQRIKEAEFNLHKAKKVIDKLDSTWRMFEEI